jgi:AcrR family transcriptional regulator
MNVHLVSGAVAFMERRAERTAETRSRIERAALKHFVEKGIAETSIRDIADEARISLGAMYNHFASKEELAWQLFIAGWNDIGDEMRRRARVHSRLSAKLQSMIEYVFRRFDEDWLLVTYVFRSRHQYLTRMPATRGNPYTIFRLVIADAMRRGEIPQGDLELKTSLVVGAIIQVVDSRILSRIKGPLSDSALATAECCVRMLG